MTAKIVKLNKKVAILDKYFKLPWKKMHNQIFTGFRKSLSFIYISLIMERKNNKRNNRMIINFCIQGC